MGDEFQVCSGCKLVKHVGNFDGFKTCSWCREHSRRYREKNKDEVNRKKREKTAQNGAFNCRGCGLRVLPEKYEAHLAGKTHQHTRESRLRTRETRIKQLQTDFPNIWSKLSEETKNDENKMNQVILKVLKNDFTDIHLSYNVIIIYKQLYIIVTM